MAGTSLNDLLYEYLRKITNYVEGATEDLALLALLNSIDPTYGTSDLLVSVTPVDTDEIVHSYSSGALYVDASAMGAGESFTVTITDWPATGTRVGALFVYINVGTNVPTVSWTDIGANVTAPTITASRLHRIIPSSIDAGATIDITLSGTY